MTNSETWRTFVAIPLSARTHQRLDGVERKLQRSCPDGVIKWVAPSKIHLTLFFLGDVTTVRLPAIREALAVVARNIAPFAAAVGGVGAFPSPRRPSVLWVGMQDQAGQLALLHRAVNEALSHVGFEPDRRPFTPHLTLGRVRRNTATRTKSQIGAVLQGLKIGQLATETITELVFFRSQLGYRGAVYTRLATFALTGEITSS
ncbi:MAG: RNA 2',3'-cyclic phosphodiesterase [Chloroflexota bacterium]|nr:RNA 2',3'-cyclic phosphodiesterase [Chloroflexota bacterium]